MSVAQGDFDAASRYHARALELAERLGARSRVSAETSNLSEVLFYLGDWERARGGAGPVRVLRPEGHLLPVRRRVPQARCDPRGDGRVGGCPSLRRRVRRPGREDPLSRSSAERPRYACRTGATRGEAASGARSAGAAHPRLPARGAWRRAPAAVPGLGVPGPGGRRSRPASGARGHRTGENTGEPAGAGGTAEAARYGDGQTAKVGRSGRSLRGSGIGRPVHTLPIRPGAHALRVGFDVRPQTRYRARSNLAYGGDRDL